MRVVNRLVLAPPANRSVPMAAEIKVLHWRFPDPASFTGDHTEQLARVIEVRDQSEAQLRASLRMLPTTHRRRWTPCT